MHRLPHGGTSRPGNARPGNGYGRPIRVRPEVRIPEEPAPWLDPDWWLVPAHAYVPVERALDERGAGEAREV